MAARPHRIAALLLPVALAAGPALAADATNPGGVCVGVTIAGETVGYLDCLNARLRDTVTQQKRQADQLDQLAGTASRPSPTQANLFNEAATAERLGDAFGRSAVPERPVRSFPSPLTNGR